MENYRKIRTCMHRFWISGGKRKMLRDMRGIDTQKGKMRAAH